MIEQLKKHPFFSDKTIESCTLLEHQGYCNENYLLVVDGVKNIVRKLLRDDINRDFEWKVQNLAFEKGITAEPLVFDSQNGFMVFSFLEGEHKGKLDKSELKLLAKTLQKLHSISIDTEPIELQTDTSTIEHYQKEYVLCHNDLNPQNVFFSNDINFIDFEYTGVNDRYFDIACVCVEFGLDVKMQRVFFKAYFDGAYDVEKLEAYKIIYKTLCEEWFQKNL
ncbi:MAG TPA: hypothetical protein ENK39_08960 [Epsilonproteobacteria bacterium]|nr:hypothetical protein [Campylobacterota bacterium]